MKKKIILTLLSFIMIGSDSFAYNPSNEDIKVLGGVYSKIDLIHQDSPDKLEKIRNILSLGKENYRSNERVYYFLSELEIYINTKININIEETFKVLKVIDGDTIKINYNGEDTNLRLIGIDSPEISNNIDKTCSGENSLNYLKELIEGKDINIEFDETQGKVDKYGRLLVYIFYNNENINGKLIKNGYAYEYTYDKDYKYKELFISSQEEAKNLNKGVWNNNICNLEEDYSINTEKSDNKDENKNKDDINENNYNYSGNSGLKYYDIDSMDYLNMGFSCGKGRYCKNMNSCEEATYYWKQCGAKGFDRDEDLIPCESLCGTEKIDYKKERLKIFLFYNLFFYYRN